MTKSNIIRLRSYEIKLLEKFRKHLMKNAKKLEKICADSELLKAYAKEDYEKAINMTYAELTRQAIYYMNTKTTEEDLSAEKEVQNADLHD